MESLPNDLFLMISSSLDNYVDLLALKLVCKEYNEIIHRKNIIKLKIVNKINNHYYLNKCVNVNCCEETKDLFIDYYREYEGRYIHSQQPAMNKDTIYINQKSYKVFSPYCCECFKNYLLFGDKPNKNIRNMLTEGFVDIEYTDAKDN